VSGGGKARLEDCLVGFVREGELVGVWHFQRLEGRMVRVRVRSLVAGVVCRDGV